MAFNSLLLADFDADSDLDVAASFENRFIRFDNTDGTGNFTPHATLDSDQQSIELYNVADLDGDGDLDLRASGPSYSLVWYANTGSGATFEGPRSVTTESDCLRS